MIYFFGDDSQFNINGSSTSNVFMFGGFIIEDKDIARLQSKIEAVKKHYVDPRIPIKWNVRALKKSLKDAGYEKQYDKLLENSHLIRRRIIDFTSDIDYKIIVSLVQDTSEFQELEKKRIEELERFAFSYCLGQLARHVKGKIGRKQVVLDWPGGNENKPFTSEYAYAYTRGTSISELYKYPYGPLSEQCFMDSPFFANSLHSTLLQFADILVGMTKDVVLSKIKPNKQADFANKLYDLVKGKFVINEETGEQGPYIPQKSHSLRNAVYPILEGPDDLILDI
ncbi:DUF3800 domain-containing protein [Sunxiuqinia sp. sy24]|uniref:DUF3800 domain-containing protein n=1 Tax=Sunxiuqinia sp. sy24 TaxID=3461495 RepID=UPI0040452D6C